MSEKTKLPKPHEYIRYVMEQMELRQIDLVKAGCENKSHVSEIVNGKRLPSLKFIVYFLKLSHRENMAYQFIESIISKDTKEVKLNQ